MTSPAPLTEAEKAAAEVLAARHNATDATHSYSSAAFHGDARAVVAAVQPIVEEPYARAVMTLATALDSLGGRIYRDLAGDYAEIHTSDVPKTVDGFNAFAEDCLAVLDDPEVKAALDAAAARQSLSLPASKETPDAR